MIFLGFSTKFFTPLKRVVKVRFTEEMYEKLKASAESRGMTISDFLRRSAFGHPIIKYDPHLIEELVKLRGAVKKTSALYKHLLYTDYEHQDSTDQLLKESLSVTEKINDVLEKLLVPPKDGGDKK